MRIEYDKRNTNETEQVEESQNQSECNANKETMISENTLTKKTTKIILQTRNA